jgi:hypothetical protein
VNWGTGISFLSVFTCISAYPMPSVSRAVAPRFAPGAGAKRQKDPAAGDAPRGGRPRSRGLRAIGRAMEAPMTATD